MQWFFKGLLVGRNHHRRAHDTHLDGYEVHVGEEQVRRPKFSAGEDWDWTPPMNSVWPDARRPTPSTDQVHSRGCPYRPMARPREG